LNSHKFVLIITLSGLWIAESFGQINQNRITTAYELLYKQVKNKDSALTKTYREYQCSKNVFGEVQYYRKNEKLQLIIHGFKNDAQEEYSFEHYYFEDNELVLHVKFNEIIRFNTTYFKSKDRSTSGMEKVLDVTETRTFLNKTEKSIQCYNRNKMEVYAKWDTDLFSSLPLTPIDCNEEFDYFANDLGDKFRLLKKAENKLPSSRSRNPKCIFFIW